ncbi:MAG: hypothetical protein MUF00_21500 [Gemmatimonadaceae bacterium]|nr:hypothetical protein [Gemmatimonadaceae bacterium]
MTLLRILLLAVAMAGGTWVFGWWMVPALGALYALVPPRGTHVARDAALGAAIGWSALLSMQVAHPAFDRLSIALSGLFPVPVWALLLVAVGFAAILASAAAALVPQR